MYCKECGAELNPKAVVCVRCGCAVNEPRTFNNPFSDPSAQNVAQGYSPSNGLVALLLAIFLGVLGIHSFYVGKTGIGIAQLLTLGGCGVWTLIDIILIVTESYRDGAGRIVKL